MKTLHDRIKEHSNALVKNSGLGNQELKDGTVLSYKESFYDISDKFHIFDRCEVIYNCVDSQFYVHYFLNNFMCVLYCHINKRVYHTPHFLDSVIDTAINSVYDITSEDELMIRFEHDSKYRYST